MDEIKFWDLIQKSLIDSNGDREKQIESLESMLAELPEHEIIEYADCFGEMQDLCYNESFLKVATELIGFVSDDGFQDFQCWLISQGKQFFMEAIDSPESLLKLKKRTGDELDIFFEFEGFYYAPTRAYEKSTGKDWNDWT